ncbi:MAG: sugar transferase [Oscillochloridaceae bacterium]|nr:sugar transferase [Chloroflexaceae bacterium]MDW8389223.1 sugar transferase [Oscillochloridaceae bacterium]
MYRSFGKRLFDLVLVVPALILLAPIMLVISLLIWKQMGRPIIFTQERAGLHGKPFRIFKFRTMTNERDAEGRLLPDCQRITPLGRFLRSTSLDELPQLWNVLRGEMSLIGPRPLLVRYLDRYTPEQNRRHEVMPGLTGLPALFGRNDQSWEDILAQDVWYVDHLSFWLDLKIIFGTLIVVIRRKGVSRSSEGIVPEFMGTAATPAPPAAPLDMSRLPEHDQTVAA